MTAAEIIGVRPISEIWMALGGEEPKHGRARAFWRKGDNPQSVSVSDAKGAWFDHRDGKGGGVLDLIQRVRGRTRSDALQWLADLNGVTVDSRPHRDRATIAALRQILRKSSYFACAVRIMAEAALESLATEDPNRATFTGLLVALRTSPRAEYMSWRGHQPKLTAALVRAGQERDKRLQRGLAAYLAREVSNGA